MNPKYYLDLKYHLDLKYLKETLQLIYYRKDLGSKSSLPKRKELCLSWTTSGTTTEKDKDYIPIPPAPDCLELTESSLPSMPDEEEVLIHYLVEEESSQDNQEYLNWSGIATLA